jgi:hypothetical protein
VKVSTRGVQQPEELARRVASLRAGEATPRPSNIVTTRSSNIALTLTLPLRLVWTGEANCVQTRSFPIPVEAREKQDTFGALMLTPEPNRDLGQLWRIWMIGYNSFGRTRFWAWG